MSFKNAFVILGVAILLLSCQPDLLEVQPVVAGLPTKTFPNVDPPLWKYLESFETEGKERGLTIDLIEEGITGIITDLAQPGVFGQCISGPRDNQIQIDRQFWSYASDIYKELIIFHELGHCFLKRPHNEGTHLDGTCLSIMRSGESICKDNYKYSTRKDYLDELFSIHFRKLNG